jgi:hypothetical protein
LIEGDLKKQPFKICQWHRELSIIAAILRFRINIPLLPLTAEAPRIAKADYLPPRVVPIDGIGVVKQYPLDIASAGPRIG